MKYWCAACDWLGESDETPFRCPRCGRHDDLPPLPPHLARLQPPEAIAVMNDDNAAAVFAYIARRQKTRSARALAPTQTFPDNGAFYAVLWYTGI